jgi:hypothetical protein
MNSFDHFCMCCMVLDCFWVSGIPCVLIITDLEPTMKSALEAVPKIVKSGPKV